MCTPNATTNDLSIAGSNINYHSINNDISPYQLKNHNINIVSVDETKDVATFYSYTDVLVYPDGTVLWYTPIITTSSCKQNPGLYPFDLQVVQFNSM